MTEAELKRELTEVTNALESAWNSTRRAAKALAILYGQGTATCEDVKGYNLSALAIFNTQKAMLEFLKSAGVANVPAAPPSPTLFTWNGKEAVVECPVGLAGLGAPQPLPTGSLKIVTSEPNVLDPQITVVDIAKANGQLGVAPVYLVVIGGIAIIMTLIAGYAFFTWLKESSFNRRVMFEVKAKAEAHDKWLTARATCVTDCTSKGETNAVCFDRCSKLLPKPDLTPTMNPASWGFWALAGLLSAGVVGGVLLYRRYARPGDMDVLDRPTRATWAAKPA